MSGIDLLLGTAIDYERTHQLAIYTLFRTSSFSSCLVGRDHPQSVLWEPEGQLFDLGLEYDSSRVLFELKMWSSLTESQQKRQRDFLKKEGCKGVYLLLGSSWFELSERSIDERSEGLAKKIGYEELIAALNELLVAPNQGPDVYELALAYRIALQKQFDGLVGAYKTPGSGREFYYSLYREIQKRLNGVGASIYTKTNPGGQVYILNADEWTPFSVSDQTGHLFCEVVNGRLCIKFHLENEKADKAERTRVRDRIRQALRTGLGSEYGLVDSGRFGAYMTACHVDHDFCDVSKLDQSAAVFREIARELPRIVRGI